MIYVPAGTIIYNLQSWQADGTPPIGSIVSGSGRPVRKEFRVEAKAAPNLGEHWVQWWAWGSHYAAEIDLKAAVDEWRERTKLTLHTRL